ncbi:MAG TPA: hypothetical protein VG389_19885 [Myxococcota bacterium]|jgi:hypothetical protein|nr:hypothetical protein [Myxococcota bacterium]
MSGDAEHVRDHGAGLMSLPADDPARAAAETHARDCAGCRAALDEGARLQALLGELPAPPPPSAEALARASAPILASLDRGPRRPERRERVLAAAAAALAWAVLGLMHSHPAPLGARALLLSGLAAALGVGGVALAFARGWTVAALAAAASAALALATGHGEVLAPLLGLRCVGTELVAALLPFAVAPWLWLRRRAEGGPGRFAGIAAAAALAGQAALHLTCHESAAGPHLLVFHTGGVLLAAALGTLASRVPIRLPA